MANVYNLISSFSTIKTLRDNTIHRPLRFTLFAFGLMLVSVDSFGQSQVFIDKQQRIYNHDELRKIRKDDLFISRRLVKRKPDTVLYLIQFYPKAEVAARFQEEAWYCGNRNERKPIGEILKDDFYARVASVKLAAFDVKGENRMRYIPKNDNQVDLSLAKEVITINKEMKNKLLDLLVNFHATDDIEVTFCEFDPRNAIIFIDDAGKQIGNIEICFQCGEMIKSSDTILSGRFCMEAFDTLQGFFRSAGIVYGTRYSED